MGFVWTERGRVFLYREILACYGPFAPQKWTRGCAWPVGVKYKTEFLPTLDRILQKGKETGAWDGLRIPSSARALEQQVAWATTTQNLVQCSVPNGPRLAEENRSAAVTAGFMTEHQVRDLEQRVVVEEMLVDIGIPTTLLDEEGRVSHQRSKRYERSPRNRKMVLEDRRAKGVLACEVCDVRMSEIYSIEDGYEVHHLRPLNQGVQVPTLDDFALLCPTCHRFVHKGRVEPLSVPEAQALIKRRVTVPVLHQVIDDLNRLNPDDKIPVAAVAKLLGRLPTYAVRKPLDS